MASSKIYIECTNTIWKELITMIQNNLQSFKDNFSKIGKLSDKDFIAVKARARAKKLIHAERVISVAKLDFLGMEAACQLADITEGDTARIKATVRNMAGGAEKTGVVTLQDIEYAHYEEALNMLIIETDRYIFTTMNCQQEMAILEAVIRGDNWVDEYALSELIPDDINLEMFQEVRDGQSHEQSLGFDDIITPDLLF